MTVLTKLPNDLNGREAVVRYARKSNIIIGEKQTFTLALLANS